MNKPFSDLTADFDSNRREKIEIKKKELRSTLDILQLSDDQIWELWDNLEYEAYSKNDMVAQLREFIVKLHTFNDITKVNE